MSSRDELARTADAEPTLILGGHDFASITEVVAAPMERNPPLGWWITLAVGLGLLGLLAVAEPAVDLEALEDVWPPRRRRASQVEGDEDHEGAR